MQKREAHEELKTAGVEMGLEDNGIGDVMEGEDRVEIHGPFSIENDKGLLSLRVLTTNEQTRTGMSSWVKMVWMA